MFTKKKSISAENMRKELAQQPYVIEATLRGIAQGLWDYAESQRDELRALAQEEQDLKWGDTDIQRAIYRLNEVCLLIVPHNYAQALNDPALQKIYDEIFLESQKERLEYFKSIEGVCKKYQPNPMGIYSLILALENRRSFETIMKSSRVISLSIRSVSFTTDYVRGYCLNNPVVEGYLGELIAVNALKPGSV